MDIKQIKKEVEYYLGRKATDEEANEILGFVEYCPSASLEEIILGYYGC